MAFDLLTLTDAIPAVASAPGSHQHKVPSGDEHAERVCRPLLEAWVEFLRGTATMLDLVRLAEQASTALGHANDALPDALAQAAGDLEYAFYATEPSANQRKPEESFFRSSAS